MRWLTEPQGERVLRYLKILGFILGLILFFEVSSYLVLNHVIDDVRLSNFETIYMYDWHDYEYAPHAFLRYVQPSYVLELRRSLGSMEMDESYDIIGPRSDPDKIVIVALGGSTTQTGYPGYTEKYLDRRLEDIGASLDVEVFNFGVSGWSSTESIQNYFYILRLLHPDYVLIHHNHNEGRISRFLNYNGVLVYPEIAPLEKKLVRVSRTYKLLKFTFHTVYNPFMHGNQRPMKVHDTNDFNMNTRISSYIHAGYPSPLPGDFFQKNYVGDIFLNLDVKYVLNENYLALYRYTQADNSTLILSTQYQNHSSFPEGHPAKGDAEYAHHINEIIRNLSREHDIPLADLDVEMIPFDHLQIDGTHFTEEGIKIKGEMVGEVVFQQIVEDYGLAGTRIE